MAVALLLCCFINILLYSSGLAHIHDRLRYYEMLKSSDISHRVHRSADPDPYSQSHLKEIQLYTLGRKFHLFLKPSKILSSKFKASIVGKNGKSVPFNINEGALFSGKLAGDAGAIVEVNYEDDGTILGSIITEFDTYIIEPSWRHLPQSGNHTMVAYRKSDVRFEDADNGDHLHSTCGIKEGPGHDSLDDAELHGRMIVGNDHDKNDTHRSKRRTASYLGPKNTCSLMVVADYTFFEHMGGSSASATALYMIHIIQFVNTVYRKTQMDNSGGSMSGIGFEIEEMRIHNESFPITTTIQNRTHYNVQRGHWVTKDLLEAFSLDRYFDNFCLSHLFTYRRFNNGVLGLAYIASERLAAVGGICSPLYPKYPRVRMSLNTGWSSSQNAGGDRILALQAQLVTAHGHNMGSEHDPETDDCAPSDYKDGKYIMYPWAVSGYDKNNQLFSPCSREYMFKVAKKKGYGCFVVGRGEEKFCGNGRIDEGETCDAGWNTNKGQEPCCDSTCHLRSGMVCSQMNSGCCTAACQPATQGTVCRPALTETCLDKVECDGISITCPNATKTNNRDNQTCIDQGICKGGDCLNFCEMFDKTLKPCICAKDTGKACHRCCKPKSGMGPCQSINNTLLPDGRPCFQGICDQGSCEKQRQDMVQRLFSLIDNISIDQLVAFMRSNIVGTVIVISLLLWIPASCTVRFIDKKSAKKEREKRNWMSRSNRTLFTEEESSRIKRIPNLRIPRSAALNASMRSGNFSRPPDTSQPAPLDWPKSHGPTMYPAHPRWPPAEPHLVGGQGHHGLEPRGHRQQDSLGFDIYPHGTDPETETVV